MIETDIIPAEWVLPDGDAAGVLGVAAESVLFSREADRLRVRTVLRWAELHPATGEDAACWGQLDGGDCEVPVNREGCPGVLSSSVADLAAALQMTTALACLCRMHHRFKTRHGWRYGRLSDHSYLWVSPTGRTYLVDHDGATAWDFQATA